MKSVNRRVINKRKLLFLLAIIKLYLSKRNILCLYKGIVLIFHVLVSIAFNRVNHHNLCNRATVNTLGHLHFDVVDSSIRTWEHINNLAHGPSSTKGILIWHCDHISNVEVSTFYRKDLCIRHTCVWAAPPTFKHNFTKKIRSPKSTLVIEKKLANLDFEWTKVIAWWNVKECCKWQKLKLWWIPYWLSFNSLCHLSSKGTLGLYRFY